MLPAAFAIFIYELAHLAAEVKMGKKRCGRCRAVVIVPTKRPQSLAAFSGLVDYVVVDSEDEARQAEALGFRCLVNKYGGKSGALATALEEVEADAYVFVDDDAVPGAWLEELKEAGCCGFATAYRWIVDDLLQNTFSLGGLDWMAWRRTRFLYGGAMAVPRWAKQAAVKALLSCPVDDMALTAVASGRIEVLPVLVPMRRAGDALEFMLRQATAAKLGNPLLWAVELLYYLAWTVAAVHMPALLVIHAARTALRSRRALGKIDWRQVALSPVERPLQAAIFMASAFAKCFRWHGRLVCKRC